MPDSVIMRIDRSTYGSQTWIVHHEGIQEIEGAEDWWLPAWEIASPSQVAVFESSVSFSFGADGSPIGLNGEAFVGTLVDAGLWGVKVDIVALDAAFPHS